MKKKQLIIISDMEGASGIFDENVSEVYHGSDSWKNEGRRKMTSDILAVCEAANEFVPDRCFFWRRIRGQAQLNPLGLITVGQHARNGEPHAYSPHTIQSPPIKSVWMNDIHIAEIGQAVLTFHGSKYIANIGCATSEKKALNTMI